MQQTFVMIKPDAVERGLAGDIIARFEKRGLKIIALKMMVMSEKLCRTHYAHHAEKSWFNDLLSFITASPIICMAVEGKDAVNVVRKMCGSTNSREADPGTIRGDLSMSVQKNVIHASDSLEVAEKEIARFFTKQEIFDYSICSEQALYAGDELSEKKRLEIPSQKQREERR